MPERGRPHFGEDLLPLILEARLRPTAAEPGARWVGGCWCGRGPVFSGRNLSAGPLPPRVCSVIPGSLSGFRVACLGDIAPVALSEAGRGR